MTEKLEKLKEEILWEGDNLEKYGFKRTNNFGDYENKNKGIELSYYAGGLCSLVIDGVPIEKITEIKKRCCYEDLCYNITDAAIEIVAKKLGI